MRVLICARVHQVGEDQRRSAIRRFAALGSFLGLLRAFLAADQMVQVLDRSVGLRQVVGKALRQCGLVTFQSGQF